MSEQRRDLSEWEYLVFFIKSKNSPLRKWPFPKSRSKSLATSAGVVVLSIIYITVMCTLLPGSPPSTTINGGNPDITQFITIAFSTAQYRSLASGQTRLSLEKSTIIKGLIEKLNNDATGFAFEVDNGQDAEIHKYDSSTAAIAALDSLLQNVVNRNPNQTNAIAVYRRTLSNDKRIQHSYVFFAAMPDDYATYVDFFNDTKNAVQEMSTLKDIKAMLVATADVTNITGDSNICIVTNTEVDNNHIVDITANYISSATTVCPVMTSTTAPSTLISTPTSISAASTTTEASTITTETSNTTAADMTTTPSDTSLPDIIETSTHNVTTVITTNPSPTTSESISTSTATLTSTSVSSTTENTSTSALKTTITSSEHITVSSTTSTITAAISSTPVAETTTSDSTAASSTTTISSTNVAETTTSDSIAASSTTTISSTSVAKTTTSDSIAASSTTTISSTNVAKTTTSDSIAASSTTTISSTNVAKTTTSDSIAASSTTTISSTNVAKTTTSDSIAASSTTTISSTPVAETTTSDSIAASSTTTTEETTTSPPLSSPPCFGDFIFVIDGSTTISQKLIWAVKNITENWNFDGPRKLRISATGSGLFDPEYYTENFVNTSYEWTKAIARMSAFVNDFTAGYVTKPTSLATELEDIYCKENSKSPVLKGTNVTFVIFTSWSDDSLIDQMTSQQGSWLKCSLASRMTVFMVGICDGASNLVKLAIPSEELYINMEYFKFTSMSTLVNKVIAKTCECKAQDSTPIVGCPSTSLLSNYIIQLLLKSSSIYL